MRWFWIDRFVEFESGRRAVTVKTVTLSEYHIDGYSPGYPTMPHSLIVEGLAQTGGLLVGEHRQFMERVVLAKVGKAVFHSTAVPGDTLVYTTVAEDIKEDGAIVNATCHINNRLQAEVELIFAHLDDRFPPKMFAPDDFMRLLRLFCLYDVAVDAEGKPLQPPARLLEAERQFTIEANQSR